MTERITINTDGSCSGNPGPGGFAAIIQTEPLGEITLTGGHPRTTTNRMELSAIIEAILLVNIVPTLQDAPIEIRTDSQYITKAFKDDWQQRYWSTAKDELILNHDLWIELFRQTAGRTITWTWIKGHAGDPLNERCDRLEVWPESHWPGFALRKADVFQSDMA